MAELKEIYANALLELSVEGDVLDENMQQAALIRDVLKSEQVESFLIHPSIPDSAKKTFLQQLFYEKNENGEKSEKVSDELMGFLHLAIDKSRETQILPSLDAFIDMGNKHKGKLTATVVSAAELRPEQVSKLRDLLARKTGKQVDLVARVDPAVIGGMYIHMEGRLIDRTVRTQLKNMKEIVRRGVSNDC
ncbi:MAG: ATP synthase F1 subunit delta [Christensenellales bacterium]|jgi:F-type H+-transporting ATPase subunit delta